MAKKEKQAEADAEAKDGEAAPEPKKGFVKKLLGNKLVLLGGIGAIVLLLGGGGAYWFFFSSANAQSADLAAGAPEPLPATPPNVIFFDVPDILVNIQGADATPAYLKLSVSLELDSPEEEAGIKALMPRVVNEFQGYLRELRLDDLKGSAGIARLKEELLRRVNAAAAPYRVRDVLLKQMLVQ